MTCRAADVRVRFSAAMVMSCNIFALLYGFLWHTCIYNYGFIVANSFGRVIGRSIHACQLWLHWTARPLYTSTAANSEKAIKSISIVLDWGY